MMINQCHLYILTLALAHLFANKLSILIFHPLHFWPSRIFRSRIFSRPIRSRGLWQSDVTEPNACCCRRLVNGGKTMQIADQFSVGDGGGEVDIRQLSPVCVTTHDWEPVPPTSTSAWPALASPLPARWI